MSEKKRIGWKIAVDVRYKRTVWVKLEILGTVVQPMDCHGAIYKKMRTDKVKVLAVYNGKGKRLKRVSPISYTSAHVEIDDCCHLGLFSAYASLTYKPGEILTALLGHDIRNNCDSGIHFCITKSDVKSFCVFNGWPLP